jgi:hypothetical protein
MGAAVHLRSGRRDRRPVLGAPDVLDVRAAVHLRHAHLLQNLLRPERGRERAGEELGRRDRALAVRPLGDEVGVEREQDRPEVGGRVAVGDRAADRPAVTDLRVADLAGRPRDEGAALGEHRVRGEVGVARQRADRDPVSVVAHVAELLEPADVDEQRRTREAQAQEGDQRVAACDQLGVLAPSSSIASSTEPARV